MLKPFLHFLVFSVLLGAAAGVSRAQTNPDPFNPFGERDGSQKEEDAALKKMLSKQKTEQEKKDYEEMLDRGNEAVAIVEALDKDYQKKGSLSNSEKVKLDDLEKLVKKIRDELGGDDDDDDQSLAKERKPDNVRDGLEILKKATEKLVDEVKRSTRFSISVVAIQSSNSVLKVIKFLRLRD